MFKTVASPGVGSGPNCCCKKICRDDESAKDDEASDGEAENGRAGDGGGGNGSAPVPVENGLVITGTGEG